MTKFARLIYANNYISEAKSLKNNTMFFWNVIGDSDNSFLMPMGCEQTFDELNFENHEQVKSCEDFTKDICETMKNELDHFPFISETSLKELAFATFQGKNGFNFIIEDNQTKGTFIHIIRSVYETSKPYKIQIICEMLNIDNDLHTYRFEKMFDFEDNNDKT